MEIRIKHSASNSHRVFLGISFQMENFKLPNKFLKAFSHQSAPSNEKIIIVIAIFKQIIQYDVVWDYSCCEDYLLRYDN